MRKAEVVISLIGMGGECTREHLQLLIGGRYVEKVMTELTKKKCMKRKNKDGITGYRLTKIGYQLYEKMCGIPAVPYQTICRQVEIKKRLRMHRNTWSLVVAYLSDVPIRLQSPFEDGRIGYYPSSFYQREMNEDVKSSRMSGYLITKNEAYLMYDMLSQDMMWRRSVEGRTTQSHQLGNKECGISTKANAIFFADSFKVVKQILERRYNEQQGKVYLESFFDTMYFFPHTREGIREFQFLIHSKCIRELENALRSLVVSPAGKYAMMEGVDQEGWEIYFCFFLELKKIGRIKMEMAREDRCRIFTLSFFYEIYQEIFPEAEIVAFDEEKVKEYRRDEQEDFEA